MTNRLRDETSPYLLQHADNPVDWHPWDETALELARENGKPILLSIGYSACHWCHVMAHESFEDATTAGVMNDLYVNIKVDREERPDIDRIYQLAQQMFTGRAGGWPLTMFLTPDTHLPIFAGTYFPRTANYGMPAFVDVLTRVADYFRSHPAEIAENGARVLEHFAHMEATASDDRIELTAEPLARARARLGEAYDADYGGFGEAPKFPHPSYLDFLLEIWQRGMATGTKDSGAATIVSGSLDAMAAGGLYDHIGGGFFRYCVDQHWGIPHFEKMLYDNAALLSTYVDAYAATGETDYARIAAETADWLRREMRAPAGPFYATLDADSEGEEGRFYVFSQQDFDERLGDSANSAKQLLGLNGPPNFEQHAWHLQTRSRDIYRDMNPRQAAEFERQRSALLGLRDERVRPGRDDKILVAWNGLLIAALAKTARRLARPDLLEEAREACTFIRNELWQDGRLLATYKDGRARFNGYLDDYAFLLSGLLELLQSDFRADELEFARQLADTVLAHFADPAGGCFFTADDHESLIHRPKPLADEAIPSGNGVLAVALTTLGHLLGEPRYLEAAAESVRAAWSSISQYPEAHATYLRALALQLTPPELVIVRGDPVTLNAWRTVTDRQYRPGRLAFFVDSAIGDLPGSLGEYPDTAGTVAYVCTGTECSPPIGSLADFHAGLGADAGG